MATARSQGPVRSIASHDPDRLARVLEALAADGCAVVTEVLAPERVALMREALYRARERIVDAVGSARLERAGERGVLRCAMRYEPVLLSLLEVPELLALVDATVSPTAILHLMNGFVLPSEAAEDGADVFQHRFHRDFPRWLNGYVASVNAFFALDDFRPETGATRVVPGTHQRAEPPEEQELAARAVSLCCPAGSLIAFDSTLWHAAGRNTSGADRLAVNTQFTRSFLKQQIDYVRLLGDEGVRGLPPRTQQLLGWYTRVPTSLDEYYRPAEERLYRAGQG